MLPTENLKGDVLYKDLNNDGLINDDDRTTIGNGPNPDFSYGLNLTAAYKGIDFSVLFQGVSGIKMLYRDTYYTPTVRLGYQINQDIVDGRWTEGRTDATFPVCYITPILVTLKTATCGYRTNHTSRSKTSSWVTPFLKAG